MSGWSKGLKFNEFGTIQVHGPDLSAFTLLFSGATKDAKVFTARAEPAGTGWGVNVHINHEFMGTYNSANPDIRAAVIAAVDRLS